MEVRLCDHGTEKQLVDAFCHQVFGVGSNQAGSEELLPSGVISQNPYANGPSPTAIAIHDGVVIGHVTSTPFMLWINGEELLSYWLGGIHVFPEFRGMGIARKLASCITNSLPIVTGVARVEPSIKAFKATNWVWPGKIADYIHIVNPSAFLAGMSGEKVERFVPAPLRSSAGMALRLLRGPMSLGIKTWQGFSSVRTSIKNGKEIPVEEVSTFDSRIDKLWQNERSMYTLTNVRRADYLNWQFPTAKGWRKIIYPGSNVVRAWGMYTIKKYNDGGQLDGLRALNVIDAFWESDDPQVLKGLVDYFVHRGHSEGVDIIMFSGDQPSLRKALAKTAFLKLPSTIWAGFHSVKNEYDFNSIFAGAYITRGYADAAGGLGPE